MAATQKAVAYYRVSGKSQIEGDGFPRQQEAVRQYATAHGIEVDGEFRDEGVSGTTGLEERPGMLALFERLAANNVDLVLIERPDRLARELLEHELLLLQFRKRRVRVVECEGGNDLTASDNPSATLIRQIFGAVAQYDKACVCAKLKAARTRKRNAEGRCEGRRALGTTPEEQRIVSRILALHGEKRTLQQIADTMNAEGLPTCSQLRGYKRGQEHRWRDSSVHSVLKRAGVPVRTYDRPRGHRIKPSKEDMF